MSDGPEQEPGAPALAQCHLLVTGKLIRGHNPDGPIRPGTEHRVTGMSSGFPLWLQSHCTPESFFKLWGGVTAVDAGRFDGGAFVYRPLRTRRDGRVKYYGLFARIQARSEGGKGQPGRRYTHCAALVVEDDWRPETIAWAARLLFAKWPDEGCLGDPNTERQTDRLELMLPALDPAACPALPDVCGLPWHAKAIGEGEDFAAEHACQSRLPDLSPAESAGAVGAYLRDQDLGEEGRWLSFGLGVRAGAIGPNEGFALIGDDREGGAVGAARVGFSDSYPYVGVPDLYDADFDWRRLTARVPPPAPKARAPVASVAMAGDDENRASGWQSADSPQWWLPTAAGHAEWGRRPISSIPANNGVHFRNESKQLQMQTQHFRYYKAEVEKFVRNYSFRELEGCRDQFQYKLSEISGGTFRYVRDQVDTNIVRQLDLLLWFLVSYSLKCDPGRIMAYLLPAFHVGSLPHWGLRPANSGSVVVVVFGLIIEYYVNKSRDKDIIYNSMKNMYEEEIEEANVCGKIKHVQKPYYHEMADVITRLMEPSTKLGKFDPDAEPVHKALREQLRIVVDQVMDELKDPVSQRADEACEDEPGADRSPPKA